MQLLGKTFHLSTIRFTNTYFLVSNLLLLWRAAVYLIFLYDV